MIRDWIVKGGSAKGDTSEWIDTIYQETDGWPRHVHSYARLASVYLKEHGGIMTSEGLDLVIEKGRRRRISYYEQRVEGFYVDEIKHLAGIISEISDGGTFDRLAVLAPLSKVYGEKESKELFDLLIEKGIVEAKDSDGYHVPIPSMHSWLVDAYVRGKYRKIDDNSGTRQLSAIPERLKSPSRDDLIPSAKKKDKGKSKGRGRPNQER